MLHFWKRCEKCTHQLHVTGSSVLLQQHSKAREYSRYPWAEDIPQPHHLGITQIWKGGLEKKTNQACSWQDTQALLECGAPFPGILQPGQPGKAFPSSKPAPGCRHRFIFQYLLKTCLWKCCKGGLWWDMFLKPGGNVWVGWRSGHLGKGCYGRFLTSPCLIGWWIIF